MAEWVRSFKTSRGHVIEVYCAPEVGGCLEYWSHEAGLSGLVYCEALTSIETLEAVLKDIRKERNDTILRRIRRWIFRGRSIA